jgi:hypothetical protein
VVVRQDESAEIDVETARKPCGRIAAMKPLPLANTTFGSAIGSPGATGMRTMAPVNCSMAFGRSDFLMKLGPIETVGQICHPTSGAVMTWPRLRSVLATRISAVSIAGGGGAAVSGAGVRLPLAK